MGSRWDAAASPKIGEVVARKEDQRLIVGRGQFSDDATLPDQAYAAVVRSPYPHARIVDIDFTQASMMSGVLAVLTGADMIADGLRPVPHSTTLGGGLDITFVNENSPTFISQHWLLPADKVRYVGEAVALVIANSSNEAKDAAECVEVRYEPLPFTIRASDACRDGATLVHEESGSNVTVDGAVGDQEGTASAFARAPHVVSLTTWIQRVTGVPIEPRAALAFYDEVSHCYTLMAGSGNVVRQKRELATVLGIPEQNVRVIANDVGGNFGTRNAFYVEFGMIAWAAQRFGRPIKWVCDRSEAFLSDYQARDLEVTAELALDHDGRFLALRSVNTSNLGAYSVNFGPLLKGVELMTSVYQIPVARVRGRGVFTNTPPTNSYRSSGRPEAMFVMERLIDIAAQKTGLDRVDIRRRNLIPQEALPFRNPLGLTYDSGAYESVMEDALARGRWSTFEVRRAEAKSRGMLRGIAVSNYVEIASGIPRERCEVYVNPQGRVDLVLGTVSSGQGHETSFAQLITDAFGVALSQVNLITGDTERVSAGGGSHAGRSMRLAGVVVGKASASIIQKARDIAGFMLNLESSDVVLRDGRFLGSHTNKSFDIFEIAELSEHSTNLPKSFRGGLAAICDEVANAAAFPYGSHVCEVEIDPDTGELQIMSYVAVDDVGRAVNPLILHGQAHGAITQGIGQALLESCVYDRDSGQLLTGSFMDYAIPRAAAMPRYTTVISEVPSLTNPLGIRAGGEGGTTPSLAVMVNAAVDALKDYGITHLEMPLTPNRIWHAIQAASISGASRDLTTDADLRPRNE